MYMDEITEKTIEGTTEGTTEGITEGTTEEIIEEIYQGYCRTIDSSRMVTCEYIKKDGRQVLDYIDCDYGSCVHSKSCKIMAQAHTKEQS